jgi:hypothetical protein
MGNSDVFVPLDLSLVSFINVNNIPHVCLFLLLDTDLFPYSFMY